MLPSVDAALGAVVVSRRLRAGRCRRGVPRALVRRRRRSAERRTVPRPLCGPAGAADRSADDRDGRELSAAAESGAGRRQPDREARRRGADREHRRQRARIDSDRLARADLSRVGGIDAGDDGDGGAVSRARGRRRRRGQRRWHAARGVAVAGRSQPSPSPRLPDGRRLWATLHGAEPHHIVQAEDASGLSVLKASGAGAERVRQRHRPELDPVRRHPHRARRAAGVRPSRTRGPPR